MKLSIHAWKLAAPFSAVFGLIVLAVACDRIENRSTDLARLPHFYGQYQKYRVTPYIAAAISLQAIGRQKAEDEMMKYANEGSNSDGIFVLCRMLYVKRPSSSFDSPGLGIPTFIGGTDTRDWPLQPIEIDNGVPFLISMNYGIYGQPPYPSTYLEYCITNCDWSTFRYENKKKSQLESALKEILDSAKWKRPLTEDEKTWLSSQIN